jgi:hypothetical protein
MQIDSKTTIAGVPIIKVRDPLRRSDACFTPRSSLNGSSSPRAQGRAGAVLNELTIDGRVVLSPDIDGNERYELATDGHALAGATARQRVTRDTAQRALDGFLARVEKINANPLAEWGVRKLVLFGSFLDPNIERVGDVALAVEMVPLRQLTKEQFDAVMRRWIHGRRRVQPGEPMLQFDVMPFLKCRNRS